MNTLILRAGLLLLHVFLNAVVIAYITKFDVSGSWIAMTGFVIALLLMLSLFILHILSFIKFYKHK